jgi:hypothetical protein
MSIVRATEADIARREALTRLAAWAPSAAVAAYVREQAPVDVGEILVPGFSVLFMNRETGRIWRARFVERRPLCWVFHWTGGMPVSVREGADVRSSLSGMLLTQPSDAWADGPMVVEMDERTLRAYGPLHGPYIDFEDGATQLYVLACLLGAEWVTASRKDDMLCLALNPPRRTAGTPVAVCGSNRLSELLMDFLRMAGPHIELGRLEGIERVVRLQDSTCFVDLARALDPAYRMDVTKMPPMEGYAWEMMQFLTRQLGLPSIGA